MACDISFERYFRKKKDGIGKKRKSVILISVFSPFQNIGAHFVPIFWPIFRLIQKVACDISFKRHFWKKKDWLGKKRKSVILISVFGPLKVLEAPFYTLYLTHSNSGLWHFIWKVFLKEKWRDRKKRIFMILISFFGPFKVLRGPILYPFFISFT